MFVTVKYGKVAIVLAILIVTQLALCVFLCLAQFPHKNTSLVDFTVVVDAGHGGVDGGVVGVDGCKESDLNLAYAKTFGQMLANCGFCVTYTRDGEGGLYGLPTKGFKMRDMLRRKQIANDANANVLISLHMNKFSSSLRRGAQVFYQQGSNEGKLLASCIQQQLNVFSGNAHQPIDGDYFVCREVNCTAVIVECGFLSNPTDCANLQNADYRNDLCQTILQGLMYYMHESR